jgi:hypothetical protein
MEGERLGEGDHKKSTALGVSFKHGISRVGLIWPNLGKTEHGNEPSGYIYRWKYFELRNYPFLKKDTVLWRISRTIPVQLLYTNYDKILLISSN